MFKPFKRFKSPPTYTVPPLDPTSVEGTTYELWERSPGALPTLICTSPVYQYVSDRYGEWCNAGKIVAMVTVERHLCVDWSDAPEF